MATQVKIIVRGAEVVALENKEGFPDEKTGEIVDSSLLSLRLADDTLFGAQVKVRDDNKAGYIPAVGDKGDFSINLNAYSFNGVVGLSAGLTSFKPSK
jgi:hypothetical protein